MVVDASVVAELLLQTSDAQRIADTVLLERETLHAPQLLDVEVTQVVRRYALRGDITAENGRSAIEILRIFPLRRYPHEPLLARMWDLRANLTAYDSAYVALAEVLRAPLLTRDARMTRAGGHTAEIRVI